MALSQRDIERGTGPSAQETSLPGGAWEIRAPQDVGPTGEPRRRLLGAESATHVFFWRHGEKAYVKFPKRTLFHTFPDAELAQVLRERAATAGQPYPEYLRHLESL